MSFKTPLLIMAAAALGFAAATPASAIDSNTVTLSFINLGVTSIDYGGTLEVTTGQDYSLPITFSESGSGDDTVWNITLLANRQNNSDIAYDFVQDTGGFPTTVSHQWSPVASVDPGYPQELNFFFNVNICTTNADIGCFTLYLGQGHQGFPTFHNNWWIGNSNLSASLDESFADIIFNQGADVHFTPSGNGVNSFDLEGFASLAAVPEPSTWALMGVGFLGLIGLRRRRSSPQEG